MVVCAEDDVVLMTGFRVGVVRYRGTVKGHSEIFAGIEIFMSDSQNGDSDGSYNGVQYFKCDAKRGTFIEESKIQRIISGEELLNKLVKVNEQKKVLEQENKNYEVMADLYLKKINQWKESLKNLEIAHDELQTEVEFLKHQLMVQEKTRIFAHNLNCSEHKQQQQQNGKSSSQNDPFQMISNHDIEALTNYLSSNKHIINAFNDPQKGM